MTENPLNLVCRPVEVPNTPVAVVFWKITKLFDSEYTLVSNEVPVQPAEKIDIAMAQAIEDSRNSLELGCLDVPELITAYGPYCRTYTPVEFVQDDEFPV